jgi:4'-phosphopantetheinyl transferase
VLASPGIAPGLHFSLSHSRTIVACVVTHAGAIGVDVEAFGDEPPDPMLLDLCCARSERELLERTDPGARGRVWTQLWTMKEAIVKALGMGLACPLQNVECALDPPRVLGAPGNRASGWEIVSILPTARTALAFAGPPAGPGAAGVALHQISADEIVECLGAMMVRPV